MKLWYPLDSRELCYFLASRLIAPDSINQMALTNRDFLKSGLSDDNAVVLYDRPYHYELPKDVEDTSSLAVPIYLRVDITETNKYLKAVDIFHHIYLFEDIYTLPVREVTIAIPKGLDKDSLRLIVHRGTLTLNNKIPDIKIREQVSSISKLKFNDSLQLDPTRSIPEYKTRWVEADKEMLITLLGCNCSTLYEDNPETSTIIKIVNSLRGELYFPTLTKSYEEAFFNKIKTDFQDDPIARNLLRLEGMNSLDWTNLDNDYLRSLICVFNRLNNPNSFLHFIHHTEFIKHKRFAIWLYGLMKGYRQLTTEFNNLLVRVKE